MRAFNWLLTLLFLFGRKESTQPHSTPQKPSEAPKETTAAHIKEDHVAADFANFLAPLIDPSKLDTLKGKRARHTTYARPVTGSRWLIQAALTPARSLTKHTLKQAHTSLTEPKHNVSPLSVTE